MPVIPAIDLIDGQVVRLKQGDYGRITEYNAGPLELIHEYHAAGAEVVHVVDLSGALDPANTQDELIRSLIAESPVALQIGGGIRDCARAEALLEDGAVRIVIGSMAVKQPDAVARLLRDFGPERIVASVDVRLNESRIAEVMIHGWRQSSAQTVDKVIEPLVDKGLRHVLCTDISRDGMLDAPNFDLYKEVCETYLACAWQASGGVSHPLQLSSLRRNGVDSAIVGRALLEGHFTFEEAIECWRNG